jgi:hypothetical protein
MFNTRVENDALSLMTDGQAENAPVERDAEGTLTGFRILKYGPLSVTKGTKEGTVAMTGEFTLEHADVIMGNFAAKGAKNPIDCNHMLYALANKAKVDESEVVKVTGRESLAMGYGDLEKRDDGLWMKGIDWSPLGKEIITSKVFRYHSPVLRGMKDDNLRVTSVSLCETPAIDHLDAIAAAETDVPAEAAVAPVAPKAEKGADAAVAARISSILGLDAGAAPEAIYSALEGIVKRMAELAGQQGQLDELAAAEETRKVEALVMEGLKDGKISNAMLTWAKGQDSIGLAAYLKAAQVFVKIGVSGAVASATVPDEAALSADEAEYCEKFGYDKQTFSVAKKVIIK